MAVDVVPATHGATAAAAPASALVPASSAIVCIAVSACVSTLLAACVSMLLGYYAAFAFYLVYFAHAVWPDRVDAFLGPMDAYVRRKALLARDNLQADLRRLRDAARAHRATAPVWDGAEECARRARDAVASWAGGARRRAEAKWGEHKDAAGVAWFVLRLAGRVICLAGTVLLDAACEEARTQAPSGLGYLKGVIHGIRSPTSSCKKGKEEEEAVAGFEFRDMVCLVGIGVYLLFSIQLIFRFGTISGMQFWAACLAAACGLAMQVDDWIDPPDDSDETDTTGDRPDAADTSQREGDAGESWQFLWVLIIIAYCIDVLLLHVTLGPRPIALALLTICNFEVLNVGRDVQLTPDDLEGAAGSAKGVDEAVDKCRWGATEVFAVSSVKVLVIYLVLDFYLAVLSFLCLCVMADLLMAEEENLLESDESGDDKDGEVGAGSSEDMNRGAEEGAVEAREERSNTSSSEDEEEDYVLEEHLDSSEEHSDTSSSEDEEEDYALEEHRDRAEEHSDTISSEDEEEGYALEKHCHSSEEREHLEEQRQEEPDGSNGGSMDDWDLVEVDPEMPAKDNCGANRKSSRLLPWK